VNLPPLPVTLVGSYPQPGWLIDRKRLTERLPSRVRARDLWRVDPEHLAEAWDDATALAVMAQEKAGMDVITDGEMRRESYSNRFANALDGLDPDHPGTAVDRTGREVPVPRVVGEISRVRAVEVDTVRVLLGLTERPVRVTLPGPFTMTQQAQNDYYGSDAELAMAYAAAVREEARDLFAVGCDIVQIDEPYLQARPEAARDYAIEAIDAAMGDLSGTTALHVCFGYGRHVEDKPGRYDFLAELNDCSVDQISLEAAQPNLDLDQLDLLPDKTIVLGVLNLRDGEVEDPGAIAERIGEALGHVPVEKLVVAPDCGMKYLPRPVAYRKMEAMARAARLVRAGLGESTAGSSS